MSTPSLEEKINSLHERILLRPNIPLSRPGNEHQSPTSGRPTRPNRLLPSGPSRRRPVDLPVPQPMPPKSSQEDDSRWQEIIQRSGLLKINGQEYRTQVHDLELLGELGNGTCGHVVKMLHKPSNVVIAVKQMRRSGNNDENKRITMDIEVVLKSDDCAYIVQCVGCFILEADVWICMELMDTCFDKLLKRLRKPIPECILGKVTVATVKALDYLKETHGVIHRDVKPSNILLDKRGNVKLCDFGISGRLVDSKAQTRSAGCAAYMAPERIDPPDPTHPDYDIRADVWSLGITLVELATGVFPYSNCLTDFEVLTKVLTSEPPRLPSDQNFSDDFRDFVNCCLTKDYKNRPKYRKLLLHPFIAKYERMQVDVSEWYASESEPTKRELKQATISQATLASSSNGPSTTSTPTSSGSILNSPIKRYCGTSPPTTAPSFTPKSIASPSLRYSSQYPQHVRSISETGRTFYPAAQYQHVASHGGSYLHHHSNGDSIAPTSAGRRTISSTDAVSGGRFSPLRLSSRMCHAVEPVGIEASNLRSTPPPMSPAHAFWQAQEARASEWDTHHTIMGSGLINSPIPERKRFPSEPPQPSFRDPVIPGNTSPLVLQRFYHQQQQHQQQQQNVNHAHHHYHSSLHNHHPVGSYFQSQPTTLHMPSDQVENSKDESNFVKKRFTSILKFNIGGSTSFMSSPVSSGRLPPPRPARNASPGPPPPSPDPPPRLSRIGLSDGTPSSSPLAARRSFLDVSPVRRGVLDGSPSLPRRYVSPSPPQPPPRRLSTEGGPSSFTGSSGLMTSGMTSSSGTNSTPGSPQVRRFDSIRARFHYTPQPQRRMFGATSDFHNL